MDDKERMIVISADSHAGASVLDYRPYLESNWHDEFDAWSTDFHDPWANIDDVDFDVGVFSSESRLSWEGSRRLRDLEADGICAEVVFPNTAPPFFPSNVLTAAAPSSRSEYERRWAGLRAHNRWLVDFCSEAPGRRAGIAQILLNDVNDTLAEIRWIKEQGLGGVLLPGDSQTQLVPMYYPRYDPIWELCADLDVPIHRHSNIPGEPISDANGKGGQAIGLLENRFFARRCLAHLIFAGVFERYPLLKFVFTETGSGWIPDYLESLDLLYKAATIEGSVARRFAGEAADSLSLLPSDYFSDCGYVAASFMTKQETEMRKDIGFDHIMWGSDYPHQEGTFPYSKAALQIAFGAVPMEDTKRVLSDTPARVYGFDLKKLQVVADKVGPTEEELLGPLDHKPSFPHETISPVFVGEEMMGRSYKA